jgi:hypothetical protein
MQSSLAQGQVSTSLCRPLEWVPHPTEINQGYRKRIYLPLTSSHLDLVVFFRYTDPARRTERSWEGSSTMRRRLGRNEGCALRAARFCSACFLVDGFKDANSSWGTSDMFASKSLKEPACGKDKFLLNRGRLLPNLDTRSSSHPPPRRGRPRYRHGRRRVIECGCGPFDPSRRDSLLSPPSR